MEYEEEDITKGWEAQDEYLSGNVREKLKLADEKNEWISYYRRYT